MTHSYNSCVWTEAMRCSLETTRRLSLSGEIGKREVWTVPLDCITCLYTWGGQFYFPILKRELFVELVRKIKKKKIIAKKNDSSEDNSYI